MKDFFLEALEAMVPILIGVGVLVMFVAFILSPVTESGNARKKDQYKECCTKTDDIAYCVKVGE